MEEQTEQQPSHRSRGLGWPIWVILVLPLVYILSSGPVMGLYAKKALPLAVVKIYRPLFWCSAKSRPLAVVFWRYLNICGFYPLD